MSDRSWSIGLAEEEFTREFMRKNPNADAIPTQVEYSAGSDPVYKGIDGVKPEDYQVEGEKVKGKGQQELNEKSPEYNEQYLKSVAKKYACRGCGRVFDIAIARSGHERGCKVKLQMSAKEG